MNNYVVWSTRLALVVASGLSYGQAILVQEAHEARYHSPAIILEEGK